MRTGREPGIHLEPVIDRIMGFAMIFMALMVPALLLVIVGLLGWLGVEVVRCIVDSCKMIVVQ